MAPNRAGSCRDSGMRAPSLSELGVSAGRTCPLSTCPVRPSPAPPWVDILTSSHPEGEYEFTRPRPASGHASVSGALPGAPSHWAPMTVGRESQGGATWASTGTPTGSIHGVGEDLAGGGFVVTGDQDADAVQLQLGVL